MEEILRFLEKERVMIESSSVSKSENPFELSAEDFIKFSEDGIRKKDKGSLINALSNIKRAIDCRIETIFYFFGIYNKVKKERWNFPKKIKILKEIGVVAPNILENINKKRNKMEHYWKTPSLKEIKDYLDIANLFLRSTDIFVKKTYSFMDTKTVESFEEGCNSPYLSMEFNFKKGKFILKYYPRLSDAEEKKILEMKDKKKAHKLLLYYYNKSKKFQISVDNFENYQRVLKQWVRLILEG